VTTRFATSPCFEKLVCIQDYRGLAQAHDHQGEMFVRNRYGKSAPIIIAGALVSGLTVIEGREPYHIEPQQCAEPSKLTYEISVSTATVTILPSLFDRNLDFT
jgi:hypothetical protein